MSPKIPSPNHPKKISKLVQVIIWNIDITVNKHSIRTKKQKLIHAQNV